MTRSKSKDHNNGRRLDQDCHENNTKDEAEIDEHVQTVISVYFEKQCDPT